MTTRARKIVGSEAFVRMSLLPGYGAFRLGESKPFQWGWRHSTLLATALISTVTALGVNGFLP